MKRVQVLIAEDNCGDVVLMQEAVRSAELPYDMSVIRDGMEAMKFLRRQDGYADSARPELIILDIKLPLMTGIEVLDQIERDPALRDIPVVVVSSSVSELNTARARRNPPYTCIAKPSTFEGYLELVRAIEMSRKIQQKADHS